MLTVHQRACQEYTDMAAIYFNWSWKRWMMYGYGWSQNCLKVLNGRHLLKVLNGRHLLKVLYGRHLLKSPYKRQNLMAHPYSSHFVVAGECLVSTSLRCSNQNIVIQPINSNKKLQQQRPNYSINLSNAYRGIDLHSSSDLSNVLFSWSLLICRRWGVSRRFRVSYGNFCN